MLRGHVKIEDERSVGDRQAELPSRGLSILREQRVADRRKVELNVAVAVKGDVEGRSSQTVQRTVETGLGPRSRIETPPTAEQTVPGAQGGGGFVGHRNGPPGGEVGVLVSQPAVT